MRLLKLIIILIALAALGCRATTAFAAELPGRLHVTPLTPPEGLETHRPALTLPAFAGLKSFSFTLSDPLTAEPDVATAFLSLLDSSSETIESTHTGNLSSLNFRRDKYIFAISAHKLPLENQLQHIESQLKIK